MSCTSCGRANRAGARFCDGCGTPLVARGSSGTEARKVVTIVFADLVGSTSLHERLDAESARRLMDRYYGALRAAVDVEGGALVKLLGDGVMAAFGVPRVTEDDAIRAVRAAVGMQRTIGELGREPAVGEIGLRVAVNTGEVVVSDDNTDVVGDPVNVAARLQQEARDGEVLIGESTQRLVGHLVSLTPFGVLTLKGRSETVAAYRVVSLEPPASAPATALVGRDEELRRLTAVFDRAVASPRARLAVVLGSPGLGKSRLLAELAHRLGDRASVLGARCDAAGGATFAPIAEALRAWLRPNAREDAVRSAVEAVLPAGESERTRIVDGIVGLLAGAPARPEETFFVVRRLLAAIATARPVVLAIDDLQWAEPLLLDLIEHLIQWSAGVPLLVLVAARPELRTTRASLATPGGLASEVVTLGGLDAGAATRLAANVIGADALPAAVAGRVLATSEGNPLFVGELVRMLVLDGVLRREGDRWTAGVAIAELEMPPTIQALLAARIDRLAPEERLVLERAAVVGRNFSRAAVAHLLPPEMRGDLDRRLDSLRRSELLEPDASAFFGEPALRFHHVLVRDAAYRRLLKGTRAELHGRIADWLESKAGESVEHDETIGWHLEQAHQSLRELGPIDGEARAYGERAARYLAAAGRRALARDDSPLASRLLGRAFERLEGDDPARAELTLDWCEALLAAGDVTTAARAIAELERVADGSDRLRAWHACFAGQLAVLTDPQSLRAAATDAAAAADVLASANDAAGEAKAHSVHATALARLGRMGACEVALDRALAAARRARDRRRANAVLAGAPLAALWGPSPVARASGRCLDVVRVLRITQGAPAVEAVALRCQAVLEALRGRAGAARRMIASSRRMVEELGITPRLLEAAVFAGLIELLDGDAAAAERWLRSAYDGLRENGLGIDAAQAAALLARALLAQGRADEAEALSHESETLAGDDLKAASAWRGVRAEALARRGEHATALELARAAVDVVEGTDALLDQADARMALTAALRTAGRAGEADAEEARAIALWAAKGATLLVERARRDVPHDEQVPRTPERPGPGRWVSPNAAVANVARIDAAIMSRDADALPALVGDDAMTVHHPTGRTYDRPVMLATWRSLGEVRRVTARHDALATIGPALALCRTFMSIEGFPGGDYAQFGPVETENILLAEVDADGRRARSEFFRPDGLAAGIARLYERHAERLPIGSDRDRAATTARAVAALLERPDLDRYATALAPGVEYLDHRAIGLGPGRGAGTVLRGLRSLLEVSDMAATRVDDVIALRHDAVLMRWTSFGTERAGGGEYERPLLMLWVFGDDGLLAHFEQFDADDDDAALRRFDELTGERTTASFENTATQVQRRLLRLWRERDWNGVLALYSPTCRLDDRRAVVGIAVEGRDFLTNLRFLFGLPSSWWDVRPIASRGDRLALSHSRFGADLGDGDRVLDEHLSIIEQGPDGLTVGLTTFDLGATDAAHAELDRLYAAGEGAPYAEFLTTLQAFRAASVARDWPALARLLPEDFTLMSHRRLVGTAAPIGREEYLATRGSMDDLVRHGDMRLDHWLRLSPRAAVGVMTWLGTVDGGEFEDPFVLVCAHDGRLLHACEIFDLDRLDAAVARYEELSKEPALATQVTNAATRSQARFDMAWSGLSSTIVATRGERLALVRQRRSLAGSDAGPGDLERLVVIEVDHAGDRVAQMLFDPGDLDGAYAELEARYDAGEGASHRHMAMTRQFRRAFADRDWTALAATLAPDLVVHDHRVLGWDTLHGPRAYVDAVRSLVELAPDVRLRIDHVIATSPDAVLYVPVWVGSRDGGPFEAPSVIVAEFDAGGRIRRFDQYDLDRLDDASARLGAVVSRVTPDPLRIPPNAVTRAIDRWGERYAGRDWDGLVHLFAPTFAFEDRRRAIRESGGCDQFLASIHLVGSSGARVSVTVLATSGDRLALYRIRFTGGEGRTEYEIEALQVFEVDAQGLLVAAVAFDPEDRRAAAAEMRERSRGEVPSAAVDFLRAVNERDLDALRTTLANDFVMDDHRRAGPGRIDGVDAYTAWVATLFEQSPDAIVEPLYTLARTQHATLLVARVSGTLAGGGAFENVIVQIVRFSDRRMVGIEVFELDDLYLARARFDELGAAAAGSQSRN